MDNEEIIKLKKELEEAKQKNIELSGKILELEDRKNEAEENLSRIKNSKAYKLSKPLRYVRSQVKRVTQYGSVSAVKKKIKSNEIEKEKNAKMDLEKEQEANISKMIVEKEQEAEPDKMELEKEEEQNPYFICSFRK